MENRFLRLARRCIDEKWTLDQTKLEIQRLRPSELPRYTEIDYAREHLGDPDVPFELAKVLDQLFDASIPGIPNDPDHNFGNVHFYIAAGWLHRLERGEEAAADFVRLHCVLARQFYAEWEPLVPGAPGHPTWADVLQLEASLSSVLARKGGTVVHLREAVALYDQARPCYPLDSHYWPVLLLEAGALFQLAMHVDADANLRKGLELCRLAASYLNTSDEPYRDVIALQAAAWTHLIKIHSVTAADTPAFVDFIERGTPERTPSESQLPSPEQLRINILKASFFRVLDTDKGEKKSGSPLIDLIHTAADQHYTTQQLETAVDQLFFQMLADLNSEGGPVEEDFHDVLADMQKPHRSRRSAATGSALGALVEQLRKALQATMTPDSPTNLVDTASSVFARILSFSGASDQCAEMHYAIAGLLAARGDTESLRCAVRHYQNARRFLPTADSRYVISFTAEGQIHEALGELVQNGVRDFENAVSAYRSAADLLTESASVGKAFSSEARVRSRLAAQGVDSKSNLETALELFAKARLNLISDSAELGGTLVNEGTARETLAELGVSPIENLRRAIDVRKEARGYLTEGHADYANALIAEGIAHMKLADLDMEVIPHLQEAAWLERMAANMLDGDKERRASAMIEEAFARSNLAKHRIDPEENLSRARALYEAARQLVPAKSDTWRRAHFNEATLWAQMGAREVGRSEQHFQTALWHCSEARSDLDANNEFYRSVIHNEAIIRRTAAEMNIAFEDASLDRALSLAEEAKKLQQPGSLDWIKATSSLATDLEADGQLERAYDEYAEALGAAEAIASSISSERHRISYLKTVIGGYRSIVRVCRLLAEKVRSQSAADWDLVGWHWVCRAKDRALLDLMSKNTETYAPQASILLDELSRLSHEIDSSEREIKDLEREYSTGMSDADSLQLARLSRIMELEITSQLLKPKWQEHRAALDSSQQLGQISVSKPATLFENLQTMGQLAAHPARKPLFVDFFALGPDNIAVFLIPLWEPLNVKAERLDLRGDDLATTVANFLAASANLSRFTRARKPRQLSAALTLEESKVRLRDALNGLQLLAAPWLYQFDQLRPTELVFSPTSLINLLPLHAIQLHGRPLIAYLPISYLPSASLAEIVATRKSHEFRLATIVGDPHNDLEGSRREATSVAAHLEAARVNTQLYLGKEARADRLLGDATRADIMHFACHSSLEEDDLERSGIELADRRLTVLDITARLRVSGTELIYLSSCDSAHTSLDRPEELGAIARAFFAAGARSMIASLWAVDDETGALFAERFYRYCLESKMPLSVAFRRAMLDVQLADSDPVKWAPFVLIGAWSTQIAAVPVGAVGQVVGAE